MTELSYTRIDQDVLRPLRAPSGTFWLFWLITGGAAAALLAAWIYQIQYGMGVAGINHPVGWGTYIANFVFWVGIAHSGTLISAILFLVRAKWRTAVSRSAEAMTLIAIATAGLFPLIHLGRFWVFYYILPYPSQRQLWPNFKSPLVWDVLAIFTYFCVSAVFFYVGLLPDLAAARDHMIEQRGPRHWRSRLYGALALGWSGTARQWMHHSRGYLYFAALATPLVISVHSIVSWDFAMGIIPGWHTTMFAPYFVAGAIHSGLAMVLVLLIPMRRILRLEDLIEPRHFDMVAQTMLVTTAIMGYSYVIEPFMEWYSASHAHRQFLAWRVSGYLAWIYWSIILLNVLAPALYAFRMVRRNLWLSFLIAVLVVLGMWLERIMIVTGSLSHGYLPHDWDSYAPSWVEYMILAGSFGFFYFCFLNFTKALPTVAVSDIKKDREEETPRPEPGPTSWSREADPDRPGVVAVYKDSNALLQGMRRIEGLAFEGMEVYSPARLKTLEELQGLKRSPVRFWTFIGAVTGAVLGYWLAIGTSLVNNLIVGGKQPVAIIPYSIVAFEGMIFCGTFANFAGLLFYTRLRPRRLPRSYGGRFSRDRFGLFVACDPATRTALQEILDGTEAERTYAVS